MLLQPSKSYKPFRHGWAVEYAIQSEKAHWVEQEAELQDDVKQWKSNKLSEGEKHHISQIFRLFTHSDVVVENNYVDQMLPTFKNNEVRQMLLSFAAREGIHQRAYALLLDTLGMPESEYTVFLEFDELRAKVNFMTTAGDSPDPLVRTAYQLAAAVCNEGMSLFSAFAMLLNYQRFGKMKGMCKVVEWSIRDEALHVQGLTQLFREYLNENHITVDNKFKKHIYSLYRTAVELEDKIIDLAFANYEIEGLTATDMKTYIRYIADRRLIDLGLKANYGIQSNPLPWLDWIISGNNFSNFFEQRVTEYAAGGLTGDWGWEPEGADAPHETSGEDK